METNSVKNISSKLLPKSKNELINNSKDQQSLPTNPIKIFETNHPYIKYQQQLIVTEYWPKNKCKHCYGTGIYGRVTPNKITLPKIQPNLPCPCGSTIKYKKCCQKMTKKVYQKQGAIITCSCVGKAKLIIESKKIKEEKE